jgi:serine/threonine protein kinase
MFVILHEPFARKIIRLSGTVGKADVQNEAQAASLIIVHGGHGNIVTILRHGWLRFSFNQCYYIDMELCEFNLHDYVNYHYSRPTIVIETNIAPSLSPAVVRKDGLITERMQNIWTVATHIARGLEFMHSYKLAHRDLKPGNGKLSNIYPKY